MTLIVGIIGAVALFALLAFTATRGGTRLEAGENCQEDADSLGSCSLHEDCDGCGPTGKGAGWWPDDGMKDGDRR